MMNNLHIYPSAFRYESRILKETKSISDSGIFNKIFIAAMWEKGLKVYEKLDGKRQVWRVPLKTGNLLCGFLNRALQHIEWMIRIFFRYRRKGIKIINCHTLSSLALGVLFKIFAKSKLIYDAHELETEKKGWVGARKAIAKISERILIPYVDSVIVVSDSIRKWYKNQYNLKEVHLIRNIPYRETHVSRDSDILKEKFNLYNDEILFIYQGVLSEERGIKILLDVFSGMDKKKHIVFMGYGNLEKMVKKYETKFSNIHFQPAVKLEEIINYTKSADIGISLIKNTCLSHYYCLPNKVFEYIFSGLPLIVSDFPDMGKLIDDYQCGWKVAVNEKSVIDLIKNISKEDIKEKRSNVLNCRNNFSWEQEEEKLLKIYQKWFQ